MNLSVKLIIIIGVLLLILAWSGKWIITLKHDRDRLSENQSTLLTKDNKVALNLKLKELKLVIDQDSFLKTKLKDSLLIKQKRISELSKVVLKNTVTIETKIKDTVIYRHDTVYKAKVLNFVDKWNKITGSIINDSVDLKISSWDSVYIINYVRYTGWFFPRWFGKKEEKMDLVGQNPAMTYKMQYFVKVLK